MEDNKALTYTSLKFRFHREKSGILANVERTKLLWVLWIGGFKLKRNNIGGIMEYCGIGV